MKLTSEEVVLQASLGHVLVNEKVLLLVQAVAQELDEVRVGKPAEEVDFRLHLDLCEKQSFRREIC